MGYETTVESLAVARGLVSSLGYSAAIAAAAAAALGIDVTSLSVKVPAASLGVTGGKASTAPSAASGQSIVAAAVGGAAGAVAIVALAIALALRERRLAAKMAALIAERDSALDRLADTRNPMHAASEAAAGSARRAAADRERAAARAKFEAATEAAARASTAAVAAAAAASAAFVDADAEAEGEGESRGMGAAAVRTPRAGSVVSSPRAGGGPIVILPLGTSGRKFVVPSERYVVAPQPLHRWGNIVSASSARSRPALTAGPIRAPRASSL